MDPEQIVRSVLTTKMTAGSNPPVDSVRELAPRGADCVMPVRVISFDVKDPSISRKTPSYPSSLILPVDISWQTS